MWTLFNEIDNIEKKSPASARTYCPLFASISDIKPSFKLKSSSLLNYFFLVTVTFGYEYNLL